MCTELLLNLFIPVDERRTRHAYTLSVSAECSASCPGRSEEERSGAWSIPVSSRASVKQSKTSEMNVNLNFLVGWLGFMAAYNRLRHRLIERGDGSKFNLVLLSHPAN